MLSGENAVSGEIERMKILSHMKLVVQEAGYELRIHPSDGPNEYQVINREDGDPVGVHWNYDKGKWGVEKIIENNPPEKRTKKEVLFDTIKEALQNRDPEVDPDQDEPEIPSK